MNSFNQLLTQMRFTVFFTLTTVALVFGIGNENCYGQSDDTLSVKWAAIKHIEQLKDGVLIVRLPTKHSSITALESTLKTTKLKPKMRVTLEEQLAEKKYERDSINNALIRGFGGEAYNFSEVFFMYDTSTTRFKEREMSGYFYNKKGEPDTSLSLEGRDYYLIYIGRTDQSTSTNTKAFVVCDSYLNPVGKPFPAYITFKSLLSPGKSGEKRKKSKGLFKGFKVEEIVKKVDGTFKWFYKESH